MCAIRQGRVHSAVAWQDGASIGLNSSLRLNSLLNSSRSRRLKRRRGMPSADAIGRGRRQLPARSGGGGCYCSRPRSRADGRGGSRRIDPFSASPARPASAGMGGRDWRPSAKEVAARSQSTLRWRRSVWPWGMARSRSQARRRGAYGALPQQPTAANQAATAEQPQHQTRTARVKKKQPSVEGLRD
jgi:hypothetical protein